jgi:hypothetical protein
VGRESEVVGEELEPLFRLHVQIGDATKRIRVNRGGFKRSQDDGVIGAHARRLVHWMGVAPLVAMLRKRLELEASRYQTLQILSVTLFEKTPILQALQTFDMEENWLQDANQLILFNL